MKKKLFLFYLTCLPLVLFAQSYTDQMTVNDLKEQVKWLNTESVELAINDMAGNSSFDKATSV